MEWFEVEIHTPPTFSDALSNFLFEQGALGVAESGTENTPVLTAYFERATSEKIRHALDTFCTSLQSLFPQETKPTYKIQKVRDTGWSERYKEFYQAQKLSHEFFLLPAWDKSTKVPGSMIPIVLEPGQAFGTGLHPSTKLSLRLIEYVFEKAFEPQNLRVLDVGTGTGILAIAAKKLGACEVIGIDIDPIAISTAKENIKMNHCPDIQLSTQGLAQFNEPFDLIASNILLEAHEQLAHYYRELTKRGGFLILSGLLGNQKAETLSLMDASGFGLMISHAYQEWSAYLFARKD